MDFDYPAEAQAFRATVREWLDANLTDDVRALAAIHDHDDEQFAAHVAWTHRLADAGLAAISWPAEYGGRGATVMEQVVFAEEMVAARAPVNVNALGIFNIAPAILAWGSDDQKARFIPRMLRADDIWCQGFSEPEAGSDLASLRTTARADDDGYVIDGQKVWTTYGHHAHWCELLARTDPSAARHAGLTAFLLDMRLPGVTVRPIRQMDGGAEFNELFLDDVRVPADAVLGPVGEGWRVAMTTLAHERTGVVNLHLTVRRKIADLIALARQTPVGDGRTAADDPVIRQDLARLFVHGELLRRLADRTISAQLHGRDPGAESSIAKLWWSELEQHVTEVAAAVLGPAANTGAWGRDRLYARGLTIAGGTTQVNKNIIAQRILGLPR